MIADEVVSAQPDVPADWLIFPVKPSVKQPLTRHGFYDAATPDQWSGTFPRADADWAVATGASGLVVLDLDPGADVAADSFPPTLTASTPRAGRHLYYRATQPVRSRVSYLPHVDVRAAGGYVVLPPASGRCWLNPEAAICELPDELARDIGLSGCTEHHSNTVILSSGPSEASQYGQMALESEAERLSEASRGERNDSLNRAAFRMGQLLREYHLPLDLIREQLTHTAESIGLGDDPLKPHEIPKTINSGLCGGYSDPRKVKASDMTAEDKFESSVQEEVRRLRLRDEANRRFKAEQNPRTEPPSPVNLADLLREPESEVSYRVERVMPVNGRTIVAAQAKAGKTVLVDNLVRSLTDGEFFLGEFAAYPPERGIVVIDTEMTRNKLREWFGDQGIKNTDKVTIFSLLGKVSSFDVFDKDTKKEWIEDLKRCNADVLLFDCLYPLFDVFGLDENRDAGKLLVALHEMATEAGISEVIAVHHMGHRSERPRGDSRFRGWPDAEWSLTLETPDDPNSRRFFKAYGRDVNVPEQAVTFDEATRHLTLTGIVKRDYAKEAVITDLYELLSEKAPMSGNQVEKHLEPKGHSQKPIRQVLKDGRSEGWLATTPGHRNATLYELTDASSSVRQSSSPVRQRTDGRVRQFVSSSLGDEHERTDLGPRDGVSSSADELGAEPPETPPGDRPRRGLTKDLHMTKSRNY